jgi:hypothetical protein
MMNKGEKGHRVLEKYRNHIMVGLEYQDNICVVISN